MAERRAARWKRTRGILSPAASRGSARDEGAIGPGRISRPRPYEQCLPMGDRFRLNSFLIGDVLNLNSSRLEPSLTTPQVTVLR